MTGKETGFQVFAGGGLGRTPVIGKLIREFLPKQHLLTYLEAILRVYNLNGRRDNKYKARIKILVNSMGIEAFQSAVNQRFQEIKGGKPDFNNLPGRRSQITLQKPFN